MAPQNTTVRAATQVQAKTLAAARDKAKMHFRLFFGDMNFVITSEEARVEHLLGRGADAAPYWACDFEAEAPA